MKTRFDELKAKNLEAYKKARGRRTLHFLVRNLAVIAWCVISPIVWIVVYLDSLDTFGPDSPTRANEFAFGTIKIILGKDS